jgi:hypothetical protein
MNKFFNQLKKIQLHQDEHLQIRGHLEHLVGPLAETPSPYYTKTSSPYLSFSFFSRKMVSLALLLVIVGGSGLTYAAELSLPGDALYPVKLNVNENVKGAFMYSTTAEAYWNETLVEKRLEEINTLKVENKLTKERAAIAEKAFVAQSTQLANSIKKLKKAGNHDVAAKVTQKIVPELENYSQIAALTQTATTTVQLKTTAPMMATTMLVATGTPATTTSDTTTPTEGADVATATAYTKTDEGQEMSLEIESQATIEMKLAEKISAQAKVFTDANTGVNTDEEKEPAKENQDTENTLEDKDVSTPTTTTTENSPETTPAVEEKTGIISGKIEIVKCIGIKETACTNLTDNLVSRTLILYGSEKKVAAEIILNKDGGFTATVPEGTYMLDMKKNGIDTSKDLPKKITVTADKTIEVKIKIESVIK